MVLFLISELLLVVLQWQELAEVIHTLNIQEIQAQQQGLKGVMRGDSTPIVQSVKCLEQVFSGIGWEINN
ncbi:MAG: hypothetical protein V7K32_10025 [Nostoc sp.]|uniref:hypothetical protein n=1 Tax=Nostoc sp. TaxID=1180 RepID=UPI002FF730FE